MPESSYDCLVIGSGPGGYVAAIRAAQLGKRTGVVESDKVGGRCLNYACIPAKALLRSADLLSEIRDSEEFGLKVSEVQVDYERVQGRREKVVTTLTSGVLPCSARRREKMASASAARSLRTSASP